MTSDEVITEYAMPTMEAMGGVWTENHSAYVMRRMADEIVRLRSALTHEAQWADAGIDSTTFWQHQRDDLVAQLAAIKAERNALRRYRSILAALREPSDMIVDALREHIYDLSCFDEAFKAIRIALAAAEADVSHGHRATQEAHNER